MWLPILGLLIGILIGFLVNLQMAVPDASYLAVAILAAGDSLMGGIKAQLKQDFDERIFLTGFVTNLILALTLAFLGVHLSVDLYIAIAVVFILRMFKNMGTIRRHFLENRKTGSAE